MLRKREDTIRSRYFFQDRPPVTSCQLTTHEHSSCGRLVLKHNGNKDNEVVDCTPRITTSGPLCSIEIVTHQISTLQFPPRHGIVPQTTAPSVPGGMSRLPSNSEFDLLEDRQKRTRMLSPYLLKISLAVCGPANHCDHIRQSPITNTWLLNTQQ